MYPRRRIAVLGTVLAMLATGLLAVAASSAPAEARTVTASVLRAPGVLTGGHELRSPNGNFTLLMGRNGDLLLRDHWNTTLWSTRTAGHHGARLVLGANGNLVLRARNGKALWATKTRGSRALLAMRSNGSAAVIAHGRTLWRTRTTVKYGSPGNPTPGSWLRLGKSLTPGHALVSRNGAARAVMGHNGNFAVRDPRGVVWTSSTTGWDGARLTLARNGHLVLYSSARTALWTNAGRAGGMVMIANNGNLIVYDSHNRAVWQSHHAAQPAIAPAASTSHYLRNLTGAATDAATMSALGRQDAASGSGKRLVVLDIGAQGDDMGDGTQWGVELTGTDTTLTDGQLVAAVEGYIDGYRSSTGAPPLLLALATNNDNGMDACHGTDGPLGTSGGAEWARVVGELVDHAGSGSAITVAGANDIEAGHAGCVDQARAWTTAFAAGSSQPYVFIGSADGCPTTLGQRGACNYGWTQQDFYDLAYGLDPHSLPVPQIFNAAQARQWATISGVGGAITFGGVLTQQGVCGNSCSLPATTAWNELSNQLTLATGGRASAGPYATDLRVN